MLAAGRPRALRTRRVGPSRGFDRPTEERSPVTSSPRPERHAHSVPSAPPRLTAMANPPFLRDNRSSPFPKAPFAFSIVSFRFSPTPEERLAPSSGSRRDLRSQRACQQPVVEPVRTNPRFPARVAVRSVANANRSRNPAATFAGNLALVSSLARTEFLAQRFPPNRRATESTSTLLADDLRASRNTRPRVREGLAILPHPNARLARNLADLRGTSNRFATDLPATEIPSVDFRRILAALLATNAPVGERVDADAHATARSREAVYTLRLRESRAVRRERRRRHVCARAQEEGERREGRQGAKARVRRGGPDAADVPDDASTRTSISRSPDHARDVRR